MKRTSLSRILMLVSLACMLPTVLPLGVLIIRGHEVAYDQAVGDLRTRTYALSSQFSLVFSDVEDMLAKLSRVGEIAKASQPDCGLWLKRNWPTPTYVKDVFRVDATGRITCSSADVPIGTALDIGFDVEDTSIFNNVLVSPVRISRSSGVPVIGIGRTYWNEGQPFRLMVTLDAGWFEAAFKAVSASDDQRLFLVNEDGKIIVSFPNALSQAGAQVPSFKRIVAPKQDPVVHTISAGISGDERAASTVMLHRFYDGRRVFMSLTANPATLFGSAKEIFLFGILTMVFALAGLAGAQWIVFRRFLAKPIKAIVSYTNSLANGADPANWDFTAHAPVEFARIAEASRSMAAETEKRSNALSEAMFNLERAEEAARLGHWRLDLVEKSLAWSDGVYKLHDLSPDTFTPTLETALDCYHPDDREAMATLVQDAIETGTDFDTVKRIRRSDGKDLYVRARGFVTYDRQGDPLSVFGIIIDVDAPKRAERELERAQVAAQTLAETRAKLLATVSHEIKAPVGAMLEIARGLKSCETLQDYDDHLALIDATGQMLLAVIGDLLDQSVLQSGRLRLTQQQVVLKDLLRQCHDTFSVAHGNTDIVFTVDVAPDVPQQVQLDPQRLRQVLFNLLSNAFKHTDHGEIRLTAHCRGQQLLITVSDSGRGLSYEDQQRVFKPFETDGANLSSVGSTGLGLSISKTLVESMNGTVHVTSKLGYGSDFIVTLPLGSQGFVPLGETAGNVPQEHPQSGPVLIVEDNPVNQKLMTAFLTKNAIPFVLHKDGQSAMEWLLTLDTAMTNQVPCLALVDINMPRLDGIGLSEFMRTQWLGPNTIPIYLVTADVISDHDHAIRDLNINGFINKPIDFGALLTLIRRTVEEVGEAA